MRRVVAFFVLGRKARVDIFFMVAHLLESDFELERALDVTARAARGQGAAVRAWVLGRWRQALLENRFEAVVGSWVPPSEGMIFSAYGRVEAVRLFAAAARVAELLDRLVAAVVKALALPMVLMIGVVLMLWGAGGWFMPVLEGVAPVERWGALSRWFYEVSTWLYGHTLGFLVMTLAGLVLLGVAMVAWSGFGRTFADRVAPFSLYRTVVGSAFLFVALEFVAAEIDLNQRTLELMRRRASPYARSRIGAIQQAMGRGFGLGQAMVMAGHGFPDPSLVPVVAALEGVRDWNVKLAQYVDRWVGRSEALMQSRAALLNGALMMLVTVLLAGMMEAMFSVLELAGGTSW